MNELKRNFPIASNALPGSPGGLPSHTYVMRCSSPTYPLAVSRSDKEGM